MRDLQRDMVRWGGGMDVVVWCGGRFDAHVGLWIGLDAHTHAIPIPPQPIRRRARPSRGATRRSAPSSRRRTTSRRRRKYGDHEARRDDGMMGWWIGGVEHGCENVGVVDIVRGQAKARDVGRRGLCLGVLRRVPERVEPPPAKRQRIGRMYVCKPFCLFYLHFLNIHHSFTHGRQQNWRYSSIYTKGRRTGVFVSKTQHEIVKQGGFGLFPPCVLPFCGRWEGTAAGARR